MFNNVQGDGKVYVRSIIADEITKLKPKRTFTLPNLVFEVENIASKYGKVITCERNKQVYDKQLKLNKNPNIELNHAKASDILNKNKFDYIWLDLCGSYSKELNDCLNCLQLSKDGKLVITISRARGISLNNPEYFYKTLFRRYNYKIESIIDYNDTFPMSVYFLKK